MPEILRVNGVSLLRDTVVVRELLTVESPRREIVTIGGQGPRGIDGETIASASVSGTSLILVTNHGQTIVVSGSILGPTGPDGASAYDVAVEDGFVGTVSQWLASLVGAPGLDGDDGRGIVSIARTAGTGAAGTTDTYTITFTDATTTTFEVVNGANGADGVDGNDGTPGVDGTSIAAGSGAPSEPAADGDLYIDVVTGGLYRWTP